MVVKGDPRAIAVKLLDRSSCIVQMAAVVSIGDDIILSCGWNHVGSSQEGIHAEKHAILRLNRKGVAGIKLRSYRKTPPPIKLTVVGRRRKSGSWVLSRPCNGDKERYNHGLRKTSCSELARKFGITVVDYITKTGEWESCYLYGD